MLLLLRSLRLLPALLRRQPLRPRRRAEAGVVSASTTRSAATTTTRSSWTTLRMVRRPVHRRQPLRPQVRRALRLRLARLPPLWRRLRPVETVAPARVRAAALARAAPETTAPLARVGCAAPSTLRPRLSLTQPCSTRCTCMARQCVRRWGWCRRLMWPQRRPRRAGVLAGTNGASSSALSPVLPRLGGHCSLLALRTPCSRASARWAVGLRGMQRLSLRCCVGSRTCGLLAFARLKFSLPLRCA